MADTKPGQWILRIDDGSTFEAPSLDVLRRWAAEGRVSPDSKISQDGAVWRPAAEVSALDMVWRTRLRDGEPFGPLHLGAVFDLLMDGLLDPEGSLENARTGISVPLRQWMTDHARTWRSETRLRTDSGDTDAFPRLRDALDRKTKACEQLKRECSALEKKFKDAQAEAHAAGLTVQDFEKTLRRRQERWDAQIGESRERLRVYHVECDDLRARVKALETEAQAAEGRIQRMRETVSASEQRWSGEKAAMEKRVSERDQRIAGMTQEQEALRRTLSERERDVVASQRRWSGEKAAMEQRASERDQRIAGLTQEQEALRRTLSERERDYAASEQRGLRERTALEEQVTALEQKVRALKRVDDKLRQTQKGRDREYAAMEQRWLRERTALEERVSELDQRMMALKRERNELHETLSGRDRDYANSEQRWLRERAALEQRIAELEQPPPEARDERRKACVETPSDPEVASPDRSPGTAVSSPPPDRATPEAPPRWWACRQASPRAEQAVIEPEIEAPSGHAVERNGAAAHGDREAMEGLRRLEIQAQAELARWQRRKRKVAPSVGALKQWFTRNDKSG